MVAAAAARDTASDPKVIPYLVDGSAAMSSPLPTSAEMGMPLAIALLKQARSGTTP
jgi:hypothetical protein